MVHVHRVSLPPLIAPYTRGASQIKHYSPVKDVDSASLLKTYKYGSVVYTKRGTFG